MKIYGEKIFLSSTFLILPFIYFFPHSDIFALAFHLFETDIFADLELLQAGTRFEIVLPVSLLGKLFIL